MDPRVLVVENGDGSQRNRESISSQEMPIVRYTFYGQFASLHPRPAPGYFKRLLGVARLFGLLPERLHLKINKNRFSIADPSLMHYMYDNMHFYEVYIQGRCTVRFNDKKLIQ